MNLWIKHPRSGQPDAMLTLGVYSVAIVLFRFLFSNVGLGPITFGQLDSTVIAAILTPTLGAYAARKYTSPPEANQSAAQGEGQKK